MKTFNALLLTLGLAAGLTTLTPNQAHAATWHKGAPTAIRGNWLSKVPRKKDPAAGFAPQYRISKSKLTRNISNMSGEFASHLSWRKVGHIYYVKSYVKPNGMVLGGHVTYKFYKSGSKTMYDQPTKHHLKRGYAFKKVSKFRNWY
ncbi:hypothetical protein IWT140_00117 [Secundilactobacillus pentosiphilus]|uniref:Extracellular protein n=1 Tax=Secundilactobacillus pentosiphilus TaxID=1714682 RepID=A0A1Z5IL85_9LACO|nr:hypothetical protein [Secundilactobacillus pentosiphilus]GAX02520.1 hypothetical protein IWT140_00117 [Secundilactobacillus pentosiphilus]